MRAGLIELEEALDCCQDAGRPVTIGVAQVFAGGQRFAAWLVIGLVLYFAYGFRNSRLRANA